jgi:hypothetical protein
MGWKMKYGLTVMMMTFLISFHLAGQPADSLSSLKRDSQVQNVLMFSVDFATNTNDPGEINSAVQQPSLSPSVAFISRWDADILVSGNFTDNSDDSLERATGELDLMFGYNLKLHKNLSLYSSYTHFLYSANTGSFKSMFNSDIRLDLDYNYRFLTLGASAGYLTGKQQSFYVTARNYYLIEVKRLFSTAVSLYFQPGLDVNFSSYEYLNLYYIDHLSQNPLFYSYLLSNSPGLRRYVLRELLKNPGISMEEVINELLEEKAQDSFSLNALNINLPLYFLIGNFGINVGLFAFIPVNQPEYLSDDMMFFLNIGVSYDLGF